MVLIKDLIRNEGFVRRGDRLGKSVKRVVKSGNCTGCGVCASFSDRIEMDLDASGFMRPTVLNSADSRQLDATEARKFRRFCPGLVVKSPENSDLYHHEVFGRFRAAWNAWADDPEVRDTGSSGGVLTALQIWLLESGVVNQGVGSRMNEREPNRTIPVRIMTKEEALSGAGSRYGPVSNG